MSGITAEVFVALGLILAGGLFALSEFALSAARKSRLRDLSAQGDRIAKVAVRLGDDQRRLLPATQLMIRLFTTLAAFYGGAVLGPEVKRSLERVESLQPSSHWIAVSSVVLGITLASLLFADLIPRRLGEAWPEAIARVAAWPVRSLVIFFEPLTRLLNGLIDLMLRPLGLRRSSGPHVTEEDVNILMSQGTQSGVFEAAEQDLVKRVFRFGDRRARAMMTPRNKVVWIDVADTPDEVQAKIIGSPHSRFPVCDQSLDNLIGFIHVKDLLCHSVDEDLFRVKGRLTIPLFIYEGTRGLKLLELFKRSSARVAVILDEFGTVDGLLTLTDILEAIVGDMPESGDDDGMKSFERSDGSWVLDATMPIDDFRDMFDMASLPDADFHTLAGLVVYLLGHIPRVGESVESFGLHFEVVDMDGNRVNKVLVKRLNARDKDL